jgi:hypothetical protein
MTNRGFLYDRFNRLFENQIFSSKMTTLMARKRQNPVGLRLHPHDADPGHFRGFFAQTLMTFTQSDWAPSDPPFRTVSLISAATGDAIQ